MVEKCELPEIRSSDSLNSIYCILCLGSKAYFSQNFLHRMIGVLSAQTLAIAQNNNHKKWSEAMEKGLYGL